MKAREGSFWTEEKGDINPFPGIYSVIQILKFCCETLKNSSTADLEIPMLPIDGF